MSVLERNVSRRRFVGALGLAGLGAGLGACGPADAARSVAATSTAAASAGSAGAPAAASPVASPTTAPRLLAPEIAAPVGNRAATTVKIDLQVQEKIAYLDSGVTFDYWTFGGTVPGPLLRARVGDSIEVSLANPAASKMPHNIDLHAVTGPGGGAAATLVAPGETKAFRFRALNPGVYVYHCAVAPIQHHVGSGMYGLIVIEPEGGLAPVDREFYVMQGDVYLIGNRGDKGLRAFSYEKMLDERPEYVVFNGAVGALTGDNAMRANVGETVRIFFGVGGPNLTSSFHVIGEVFDRVATEGGSFEDPAKWATNVQSTHVPAGGATLVEFKADVPGELVLVDHSLGRVAKGAVGHLVISGAENPDVFAPL